jgi:2,5-furandicarboxylate decarboxylase 1
MSKDLRTFIRQVQERFPDDYLHVRREVDPNLELTAVLRKLQDEGRYPSVLFERVRGSELPVLANGLASRDRLALLFDTNRDDLVQAYVRRQNQLIKPVVVPGGPVKDVVDVDASLDLMRLPQIVHCGEDAGAYISSGVVIARDPDNDIYNAGIYRIQIVGERKLRIYPGAYSHLWHLHRKQESRDKPLDIAIVIGHYPTLHMASQYRGPLEVDELEVAGGLAQEALRVTPAETVDLNVPADAEIVIEGRILPHIREEEGPFGEFTWYLGPAEMNPVVEVTAVTRRHDAIYQDVFNAHPEHNLIGMVGREANMYAKVKATIPTVKAVTLPFSACCRHAVYISIKKEYDGVGRNCGLTALGADPFVKLAIIVDDDINVFNEAEVMWAVATRVQADKDLIVIPESYVCELDPSAYDITNRTERGYLNAKWIIDATKPVGLPFQHRADVPEEIWRNIRLDDYFGSPAPEPEPEPEKVLV